MLALKIYSLVVDLVLQDLYKDFSSKSENLYFAALQVVK